LFGEIERLCETDLILVSDETLELEGTHSHLESLKSSEANESFFGQSAVE